jgi:hypothetical protein
VFGVIAGQVVDIGDVGTKTGRAGKRAIGAAQTAIGHHIPLRMVEVFAQQRRHVCHHAPRLGVGGVAGRCLCGLQLPLFRRSRVKTVQDRGTARAAAFDQERTLCAPVQFSQRQVKPVISARRRR